MSKLFSQFKNVSKYCNKSPLPESNIFSKVSFIWDKVNIERTDFKNNLNHQYCTVKFSRQFLCPAEIKFINSHYLNFSAEKKV